MQKMNKVFSLVLFATLTVSGMALSGLAAPGTARADQNSPRLPGLFEQLQSAGNAAQAAETEREIWKIWSLPDNRKASVPFAQGVILMNQGDLKQALRYFDTVVTTAPEFAEGWNKRATVAYYLGDYETSVHDIRKTLALEPRHFGALAGLAMIYEASGLEAQALDVLIQVKEIHPSMTGIDAQMEALRAAIAAKKT